MGGICLAAIIFLSLIFRFAKLSKFCPRCGHIECYRCGTIAKDSDVCVSCNEMQAEEPEPFSRIFQTIQINNNHKIRSYLSILFSFLVPGTGHFLLGKSFMGLLISVVFFVFLLKTFFFNGIIIDAFDLTLMPLLKRYIMFYVLLLFFYVLIIQNVFYEVRNYNER